MSSPQSWLTIDLKAIDANLKQFRRLLKPEVKIMAIVKANAYGHGLFEVAEQAIHSGASYLGVATLDEAITLRRRGIIHPIVMLSIAGKDEMHDLIKNKIGVCIGSEEGYRLALRTAGILNRKALVHIKVDTGLNRLGFTKPDEVVSLVKKIKARRRELSLEGIYSHLASVEELNQSYTNDQILVFEKILKKIEALDVEIPIISIAASGAAIMLPKTLFNCVRIGIAMYGIWPSRGVELWSKRSKKTRNFKLRPALSYKTRLISIKRVKAGSYIGYGCNFQAPTNMTIGVVPVGYYEGYDRSLSNMGFALLKGAVVPVVGRVCMNMTFFDISKRPRAKVGDEVVLIGKSENKIITATDLGDWAGTISYEILSRLPAHIPRIYKS